MKIYLIRHGETTGDVEDRYGGSYDDHLTELGKTQIEKTAEKLINSAIEIVFTSVLIRAKESGEIIAAKVNCPIETREGLQERHYGILTGLTKREALEKYPEVVEAHKDPQSTDPEGESRKVFQNRVLTAFEKLTNEQYRTIAIVAHGGPIKEILHHLNMHVPEKIGDGGVIVVEL